MADLAVVLDMTVEAETLLNDYTVSQMIRLVGSIGVNLMIRTVIALAALTAASGSAALAASPFAATADTHSYPTKLSINSASYPFVGGNVAAAVPMLQSAADPNVPGATGMTIVPGDRSTIIGDRTSTLDEQTGFIGGGG